MPTYTVHLTVEHSYEIEAEDEDTAISVANDQLDKNQLGYAHDVLEGSADAMDGGDEDDD
jgi:hypothetical protein